MRLTQRWAQEIAIPERPSLEYPMIKTILQHHTSIIPASYLSLFGITRTQVKPGRYQDRYMLGHSYTRVGSDHRPQWSFSSTHWDNLFKNVIEIHLPTYTLDYLHCPPG
jgi:hypothetical protein